MSCLNIKKIKSDQLEYIYIYCSSIKLLIKFIAINL